jgi:hypothetical protein
VVLEHFVVRAANDADHFIVTAVPCPDAVAQCVATKRPSALASPKSGRLTRVFARRLAASSHVTRSSWSSVYRRFQTNIPRPPGSLICSSSLVTFKIVPMR